MPLTEDEHACLVMEIRLFGAEFWAFGLSVAPVSVVKCGLVCDCFEIGGCLLVLSVVIWGA